MRLQAFVVTVIMLATFFGCSEGPLAAAPSATDEVTDEERRVVCEHAADVWSSVGRSSLEELRDATVALYQQTVTLGTTTQKRHVGSATTGVGTATALSVHTTVGNTVTDSRVQGSLERFEQAMERLDADCQPVGVDVVPTNDAPSI